MKRLTFIVIVILVTAVFAWLVEPSARGNTDLFVAIITLFSIFAGFLVAVMSLSADPVVSQEGGWGVLELSLDGANHKMNRARLLFYAYLIAATLILIVLALQKSCDPVSLAILPVVNFLCLWFTGMGVIFSFALPSMLIAIQQTKMSAEIERRRGGG